MSQKTSVIGCFGAFLALVVMFIALSYVSAWYEILSTTPPKNATTLNSFFSGMPPPRHLAILEIGGSRQYVWIGQLPGFPAVPSGPPVYVFDAQGQLVDWASETGDGGPLDGLADAAWKTPSADVKAVQKKFPPNNKE